MGATSPAGAGKLGDGPRVRIASDAARAFGTDVMAALGCRRPIAGEVAAHLVEASLMEVHSHGLVRLDQYARQVESGYLRADAPPPELVRNARGAWLVDAHGGIGIPAMSLAVRHLCEQACEHGIAATAVVDAGHTGRLGAFVEQGARQGFLTLCIGGGGRENWRMVTPHGGAKALLPTNPYALGMPGGERGPVVVDFATAAIAGGWIYAARSAGLPLPEGAVIDAAGRPTRDPADYFAGGAILPAGGAKGYGLALIAELVGEAMLGPVTTEASTLVVGIDTTRYRDTGAMTATAEAVLAELRECPPAPGFARVEVPGERERAARDRNEPLGVALPEASWSALLALAGRLGVAAVEATAERTPAPG